MQSLGHIWKRKEGNIAVAQDEYIHIQIHVHKEGMYRGIYIYLF